MLAQLQMEILHILYNTAYADQSIWRELVVLAWEKSTEKVLAGLLVTTYLKLCSIIPQILRLQAPLEVVDVYPPPQTRLSPGGHVVSVEDEDVDFDTGGKRQTTWKY